MLIMLLAWLSLYLTTFLTPPKNLWTAVTTHGFCNAILSILWMYFQDFNYSSSLLTIDKFSAPMTILTCWLFPLTMLASQNKLKHAPMNHQLSYIYNSIFLQLTTLLAFMASNTTLFFMFFEASLFPTLAIITRWGTQDRRLKAGLYLAFYTMAGAAFLLLSLALFNSTNTSLMMSLHSFLGTPIHNDYVSWIWFALNMAFLVKLPMFCLHLWLPKAHVEAPIAGSMILAGTLMKLGNYGILRNTPATDLYHQDQIFFCMVLAAFGVLFTAATCLRQTDLKTMIAMSSVSHMNLVLAASLIESPSSYSGAMVLMVAHALTSSALFCLANYNYERMNTRVMILLRGTLFLFPLAGTWWLIILLSNMALPPTINFTAETLIMMAMFNRSTIIFLMLVLNMVTTTAYTLYMLWSAQRGSPPNHMKAVSPLSLREHLLLLIHILPGLLLIACIHLIFV